MLRYCHLKEASTGCCSPLLAHNPSLQPFHKAYPRRTLFGGTLALPFPSSPVTPLTSGELCAASRGRAAPPWWVRVPQQLACTGFLGNQPWVCSALLDHCFPEKELSDCHKKLRNRRFSHSFQPSGSADTDILLPSFLLQYGGKKDIIRGWSARFASSHSAPCVYLMCLFVTNSGGQCS